MMQCSPVDMGLFPCFGIAPKSGSVELAGMDLIGNWVIFICPRFVGQRRYRGGRDGRMVTCVESPPRFVV